MIKKFILISIISFFQLDLVSMQIQDEPFVNVKNEKIDHSKCRMPEAIEGAEGVFYCFDHSLFFKEIDFVSSEEVQKDLILIYGYLKETETHSDIGIPEYYFEELFKKYGDDIQAAFNVIVSCEKVVSILSEIANMHYEIIKSRILILEKVYKGNFYDNLTQESKELLAKIFLYSFPYAYFTWQIGNLKCTNQKAEAFNSAFFNKVNTNFEDYYGFFLGKISEEGIEKLFLTINQNCLDNNYFTLFMPTKIVNNLSGCLFELVVSNVLSFFDYVTLNGNSVIYFNDEEEYRKNRIAIEPNSKKIQQTINMPLTNII